MPRAGAVAVAAALMIGGCGGAGGSPDVRASAVGSDVVHFRVSNSTPGQAVRTDDVWYRRTRTGVVVHVLTQAHNGTEYVVNGNRLSLYVKGRLRTQPADLRAADDCRSIVARLIGPRCLASTDGDPYIAATQLLRGTSARLRSAPGGGEMLRATFTGRLSIPKDPFSGGNTIAANVARQFGSPRWRAVVTLSLDTRTHAPVSLSIVYRQQLPGGRRTFTTHETVTNVQHLTATRANLGLLTPKA